MKNRIKIKALNGVWTNINRKDIISIIDRNDYKRINVSNKFFLDTKDNLKSLKRKKDLDKIALKLNN